MDQTGKIGGRTISAQRTNRSVSIHAFSKDHSEPSLSETRNLVAPPNPNISFFQKKPTTSDSGTAWKHSHESNRALPTSNASKSIMNLQETSTITGKSSRSHLGNLQTGEHIHESNIKRDSPNSTQTFYEIDNFRHLMNQIPNHYVCDLLKYSRPSACIENMQDSRSHSSQSSHEISDAGKSGNLPSIQSSPSKRTSAESYSQAIKDDSVNFRSQESSSNNCFLESGTTSKHGSENDLTDKDYDLDAISRILSARKSESEKIVRALSTSNHAQKIPISLAPSTNPLDSMESMTARNGPFSNSYLLIDDRRFPKRDHTGFLKNPYLHENFIHLPEDYPTYPIVPSSARGTSIEVLAGSNSTYESSSGMMDFFHSAAETTSTDLATQTFYKSMVADVEFGKGNQQDIPRKHEALIDRVSSLDAAVTKHLGIISDEPENLNDRDRRMVYERSIWRSGSSLRSSDSQMSDRFAISLDPSEDRHSEIQHLPVSPSSQVSNDPIDYHQGRIAHKRPEEVQDIMVDHRQSQSSMFHLNSLNLPSFKKIVHPISQAETHLERSSFIEERGGGGLRSNIDHSLMKASTSLTPISESLLHQDNQEELVVCDSKIPTSLRISREIPVDSEGDSRTRLLSRSQKDPTEIYNFRGRNEAHGFVETSSDKTITNILLDPLGSISFPTSIPQRSELSANDKSTRTLSNREPSNGISNIEMISSGTYNIEKLVPPIASESKRNQIYSRVEESNSLLPNTIKTSGPIVAMDSRSLSSWDSSLIPPSDDSLASEMSSSRLYYGPDYPLEPEDTSDLGNPHSSTDLSQGSMTYTGLNPGRPNDETVMRSTNVPIINTARMITRSIGPGESNFHYPVYKGREAFDRPSEPIQNEIRRLADSLVLKLTEGLSSSESHAHDNKMETVSIYGGDTDAFSQQTSSSENRSIQESDLRICEKSVLLMKRKDPDRVSIDVSEKSLTSYLISSLNISMNPRGQILGIMSDMPNRLKCKIPNQELLVNHSYNSTHEELDMNNRADFMIETIPFHNENTHALEGIIGNLLTANLSEESQSNLGKNIGDASIELIVDR